MTDPANLIIELYEDKKRGPNPKEGENCYWFRIREFPSGKLHEGLETMELAQFYIARFFGIPTTDQGQVGYVDLVMKF